MTRLWEVADELAAIAQAITDQGGEIDEETEARLAKWEGELDTKVERIALYVRESELEAEKAKAEVQRLAAIQKAHERTASGLKGYLLRCLASAGLDSVDTHRARVRRQRSGTPSINYVGDLDVLPESFIRVVPETRTLDKKAVTEAVRAGEELPDGFHVTYSEFVRIL